MVGDLESSKGRFIHTSNVMPMARHFTNKVDTLIQGKPKNSWVHFKKKRELDLHLWNCFYAVAHKRISMNLVVHHCLTKLYFSDSCPAGLGGMSSTGIAWQYIIPEKYQNDRTNNCLKYLASFVSIWVDAEEGNLLPLSVIPSLTDSSSVLGWLFSPNFYEDTNSCHTEISRKLVRVLLDKNCILYG